MDPSLEMRVALTFTAQNLKNADLLSRSDPYLIIKDARGNVIGRTETTKNQGSVSFTREIECVYKFEEEQLLHLIVMDDDHGRSDDDFLGMAQFRLGTLMGSRGQSLKLQLTNKSGRPLSSSTVSVHAEQATSDDTAVITFRARNLDNKDGYFSKSDPFFIFSISEETGGALHREIYRSEYVANNLNPNWKAFSVPVRRLTNRQIRIDVYDYDATGNNDLIGTCHTTLKELQNRPQGLLVIHPPTKSKYQSKSYNNSGYIDVMAIDIEKRYTMIDYLRGGLEVCLAVAVDFTGSNGDPRDAASLHYGGGTIPNAYTKAIQGVGQVLLEYDSNKMVPALGFGARLQNSGNVTHCFAMSMGPEEVYGVEGVLGAYRNAFSSGLSLSGPTYFNEILKKTADIARGASPNSYHVVLILTDGVLNDVNETIDALVDLSFLPVSVIIVGVGKADFSQMNVLDADVNPLVSSRGVRSNRDCVQFVDFNRVGNDGAALARETLMELPAQVVDYMRKNKRAPGRPIQVQEHEIVTVPFAPMGGVSVIPPPPIAGYGAPQNPQAVAQTGRELFRGAISM